MGEFAVGPTTRPKDKCFMHNFRIGELEAQVEFLKNKCESLEAQAKRYEQFIKDLSNVS